MNRKTSLRCILTLLCGIATTSPMAYEAVKGPTGVIQWDKATAFDGYTLLAPSGPGFSKVYLIDNKGWVAHEWDLPGGGHTEILENGDIIRLGAATSPDNFVNWGGTAGQIAQYKVDGSLNWQYTNVDADSVLHHTFHQTSAGNTFVPVWERHSAAEATSAGRVDDDYLNPLYTEGDAGTNPSRCARSTYCGGLWTDAIVELDSQGHETGWRWDTWDKLTVNSEDVTRLDINYHIPEREISNRSTADYMHVNSVHFDPVNELLVISSRSFNEIYLIDYQTKEIVGRWGNPWATKSGNEPSWMNDGDTKLWGPHGANFSASVTGEVTILVLDNGWMRPEDRRSRVFEIKFRKTGDVWTPDATPVWEYQTVAQQSLLTDFQGGVQRLPNGNTLIASSGMAHLLEVTPDKKVAWEFISPVFNGGEIKCKYSAEDGGPLTFFRAYKYAANHPGIKKINKRIRSPFSLSCPNGP
ncbi:MAG: aryl-sulfate sulfotransferase, partial [Methylococcaceae bacterium]